MSAASQPSGIWICDSRWDDYQHRDAARSKVLPWIKNETKLLSSPDYVDLSGHRRAVLHGIWLEYARSLRRLPDDTATLSRRLGLRVARADLEALSDAGFIEFSASRPASNPASRPAGGDGDGDREGLKNYGKGARTRETPADRDVAHVRKLIENGVILDQVDLDAELRAHQDLSEEDEASLGLALAAARDGGAEFAG